MAQFDLKLLGGFEARLDSGQKIALPTTGATPRPRAPCARP
jgi:hypothetical protein